jgi:hypothetical protein
MSAHDVVTAVFFVALALGIWDQLRLKAHCRRRRARL